MSSLYDTGRPIQYKNWSEENLHRAYLGVINDKLSIRQAAEEYCVPKSTLQDRVCGKIPFGSKSGPAKYLTDREKQELVEFIVSCASIGYAKTKQQLLHIVRQTMKDKKQKDAIVSEGWWVSFKNRNKNVTIRKAEKVSYIRSISSRPEILEKYYDLLHETLVKNEILDKPCQLFNMDETGMPLNPEPPKIIAGKGQKHPVATTSGEKSQITVVSCCNAGGYVIPPMVIFDRKVLKPELTLGEVPGTMYGLSSNGWIDSDLFEQWFRHHFLAYAPPVRPLLLIMDGHSSHFNPTTINMAAQEEVLLFVLPPHTTHLTQPLDKGPFGPLKQFWRQECYDYITKNPGKVVTRFSFSQLFSHAWTKAMTISNITAGFKVTGIYPFNPQALLPAVLPDSTSKSLTESTGLKFIPFSPSSSRRHFDAMSYGSPQSHCCDNYWYPPWPIYGHPYYVSSQRLPVNPVTVNKDDLG